VPIAIADSETEAQIRKMEIYILNKTLAALGILLPMSQLEAFFIVPNRLVLLIINNGL
jgi:hypothetical protein